MSRYTRVGRARPQGGGLELAIWYLMRLTGLALFVLALAHFLILHLVVDPSVQTANWILMDYGDVVFHVFQEEARRFYALERLWGDAPNDTGLFKDGPAQPYQNQRL